jgi:hypothetical protein
MPTERTVAPIMEIPDSIEELDALYTVAFLRKCDLNVGSELDTKTSTRQRIAVLYSQPLVCNLDSPLADDSFADTPESYQQSLCEGLVKVCF